MATQTQFIGFFRWAQVREVIPVSKTVWWEGVRKGRFPPAYRITSNTVGWSKVDIHKLANHIKKHGTPPHNFNWSECPDDENK